MLAMVSEDMDWIAEHKQINNYVESPKNYV